MYSKLFKKLNFIFFAFLFGIVVSRNSNAENKKSNLINSEKKENKASKIKKSNGIQITIKNQKFKIKEVPIVDVDFEDDIVPRTDLKKYELHKVEPIPSSSFVNIPAISLLNWNNLIIIDPKIPLNKNVSNLDSIAPLKDFKLIPIPALSEKKFTVIDIDSITPQEFKLIEALVFLQLKENYELALALLAESIKDPRLSNIAKWSFTLASTHLGLRQESIFHLLNLEKIPEWKDKAVLSLLEIIKATDVKLAGSIAASVKSTKVDQKDWGAFTIAWAKLLIDEKKLNEAQIILEAVNEESPFKSEAMFLNSIVNYRSNNINLAEKELSTLLIRLEKEKTNWDLKSLTALTLARIYFQKEDYTKSFNHYLKIEKGNSIWVQSLVETAWAQILAKDYEGAAGNMFSLHTDYFKGAYQPESYIVRTVSYLNLCQYGDSLTVLKDFLRKYKMADVKTDEYLKNTKKENTYDTVKKLLTGNNLKEVDGLPKSLIIEMARDPNFLASQNEINTLEDEITLHEKIQTNLRTKEKQWAQDTEEFKKRIIKIKDNLKSKNFADQKTQLQQELQSLEKRLTKTILLQEVTARAYVSLKNLQADSIPRLTKAKDEIKAQASITLYKKLEYISKDLKHWLEQSQLLEYEIFSGAGEQLRYHMADNEGAKDEVKKVKKSPTDSSMKWDFQGEIWEDEIGNFRSSLKNVCPEDNSNTQVKK
jgi:hypothetical protein